MTLSSIERRWRGWFVAFAAATMTTAVPALERITEGPVPRQEIVRSVAQLFAHDEFELIDRMADKLWHEKTRLPEGAWKLAFVYDAFAVGPSKRAAMNWTEYFARFERWEKQRPQSATAKIGHAEALVSYAWAARGGGFAPTVSEEGWKLFAQRLDQAHQLLDSDPALRAWPGYYQVMMTVALGQGWPRAEYDRLFADAVKLAPDYETFYFRKNNFLQEKWYGRSEYEWHEFALQAAKATEAQFGQAFYTRVVWAAIGTTPANLPKFRAAPIDWPKMRTGFEDLQRQYPKSLWNLNAFAFYAWAASDRATARRVFDELAGRYAPPIWGDVAAFQKAEAWAHSDEPAH